jgi:hypothetical protein
MKIVKVTYTAKAEYAEHNQKNIKNVMADLEKLHHPGINYNSCLSAGGKTFIHTAFFIRTKTKGSFSNYLRLNIFSSSLNQAGLKFLQSKNS